MLLRCSSGPDRPAFTRSSFLACVALGVATGGGDHAVHGRGRPAAAGHGQRAGVPRPARRGGGPRPAAARRLLWPALAAVGVLLLTEPWRGSIDPVGVAFALGAAVCWAAYILLTQRVGDEVTGFRGLAVSMPVAGLLATAGRRPVDLRPAHPGLLLAGLGLAVLLPVVPFCLELLALRRLTTAAFGTLMSLEPAIALVVGLVLHQVPARRSRASSWWWSPASAPSAPAGARSSLLRLGLTTGVYARRILSVYSRGMSVPLTLLGLLEREPSHGYDLKRDYDTFFGRGKPLPFGQVYATLGRLARDGKVVVGEAEPGAGPDRKRYVITERRRDRGRDLARRAGRAGAAPADRAVRQGRAGADARAARPRTYLDTQRAAHLQRMRELTELKRDRRRWSTRCSPTTACSTSRPTCAGSS